MKKLFSILLIIMIFSISACGKQVQEEAPAIEPKQEVIEIKPSVEQPKLDEPKESAVIENVTEEEETTVEDPVKEELTDINTKVQGYWIITDAEFEQSVIEGFDEADENMTIEEGLAEAKEFVTRVYQGIYFNFQDNKMEQGIVGLGEEENKIVKSVDADWIDNRLAVEYNDEPQIFEYREDTDTLVMVVNEQGIKNIILSKVNSLDEVKDFWFDDMLTDIGEKMSDAIENSANEGE